MTDTSLDLTALVIGSGFGASVMAPAFTAQGCDVQTISSRHMDDVEKALAGRAFDIVSIHSPPFLHLEHTRAALASGARLVLCDKPFGQHVEAARALVDVVHAGPAPLVVNYEFRHQPWRRSVKQLVDAHVLGEIESVHWLEVNDAWRGRETGWQLDPTLGGGWFGASLSHVLDTLRWWLGDLTPHGAVVRSRTPDQAELGGEIVLTAGGTLCRISSSGVESRNDRRVIIDGTEGRIEIDAAGALTLVGVPWPEDVHPPGSGNEFSATITRFCTALCQSVRYDIGSIPHDPRFASAEDGLAIATALDTIRTVAVRV